MVDVQTEVIEPSTNQASSISAQDLDLNQASALKVSAEAEQAEKSNILQKITWKQIRGGALFVVGWLLSPLCWWNDLIFNLPVAYGFGHLCRLFSAELFIPGLITGYWISNVVGILLMQFGAIDAMQKQAQERSLKQDLFTGIVSSTVYTGIILALVQFHIIDMPTLFAGETPINLGALLPVALPGQ